MTTPPVHPDRLRLAALRRQTLLVWLCALFVGFFVAAELLGAKLWRFTLLGLSPRDLGLDGLEFVATAGILAFPLTFILTDIINEYFGIRVVRLFSFAAIGVNLLLQVVVQVAVRVPTISFTEGVEDATLHQAYRYAFGQSWAIVVASAVAFLIGQLLDVYVFTFLRRISGEKWLWLRAQGSTVVSQLVDTFVVIYLAFVVLPAIAPTGQGVMSGGQAFEVSLTNYVYKFAIAVGITPLLYVVHGLVDLYLGKEEAHALVREAHPD